MNGSVPGGPGGEGIPSCAPGQQERRELLHVDCASHVYPDGTRGIHELCFRVYEGEIVALCGPNGAGKSTLIEHLNGLLQPSSGRVTVLGKETGGKGGPELWRFVGVVFQRSDDQLFAPTVLDDVMFGPLNMGLSPDAAKTAAMEALEAVGAKDLTGKLPNYLSGGQKRLVSLAGILAMKPRVIALDEPTSDLDPVHSDIVEHLIFDLKNRFGISVVIATHDLDLAARIADRICLVRQGSVVAEGEPAEIFYDEVLLHETGLKSPQIVRVYLAYCQMLGIAVNYHPITIEQMIEAIRRV